MFNRHGWISSTVLYAALLTLPVLLYVFLYQGSRIDEATMRNFRSLDTAADRIKKALDTFRSVSKNYSLGVDSTLLREITEACPTWNKTAGELKKIVDQVREQSGRKLATRPLIRQPSTNVRSSPLVLPMCEHKLKIDVKDCQHGVRFGPNKVISHNCQRLRERYKRVYDALNLADGGDLITALDQFGIEVSINADDAFDVPTRHLSMFFDDYFIADKDGNIIFTGNPPALSHDEHRRHRTATPFAGLASVEDILTDNPPASFMAISSTYEPNSYSKSKPIAAGHSIVRNIEVDNVDLSVFVHPFTAASSKLYVVGVVLRSSLTNEAIRLRLGPAVDATLTIAVLLTLLPLLRFWTAGDRSIFRRFNLYSVGASALAASALATALVSGMIYKARDGQALDQHLARISNDIINAFAKELTIVGEGLDEDREEMIKAIEKEADRPEEGIRQNLFCQRAENPSEDATRNWWPTSSYLLDAKGQRTICKRYRSGEPLKLDLAFRDYYLNAKKDKIGLYRIDSVVRGEKQVVASREYQDEIEGEQGMHTPPFEGLKYVAVTISKFMSIDDIIIPPPFQYAVIDKYGDTIFHSDEDRISISNFMDDTGNSAAIHAAIKHRRAPALNANYDGLRIRAYLRPLHPDVDWTLVVFRAHGMVDRVSSLATSLSIISWVVVTVLIFAFVAVFAAVPRPHGRKMLPEVVLISTDGVAGALVVVFGTIGVAIAYFGGGDGAWAVGLALPAVVTGVILVLAWTRLCRPRSKCSGTSTCGRTKPSTRFRVLALALVIFSFAIAPMLAWQIYFQSQLSEGLVAYLETETHAALEEKLRDIRKDAKDLVAYADDVDRPKTALQRRALKDVKGNREILLKNSVVGFERLDLASREAVETDERKWSWAPVRMWSLLAYSPVTQRSMWHRAASEGAGDREGVWEDDERCGVGARGVRFVSDAVGRLIGCPVGQEVDLSDLGVGLWFVILVSIALFVFVCYSVVRSKFGHARQIDKLPLFSVDDFKKRSSKRLQLVTRSERDVLELKKKLSCQNFVVKQLMWRGDDAVWEEFRPNGRGGTVSADGPRTIVFVIENLRRATDGWRSNELAVELSGKVDEAVIICSDVVPSYHMCPGTLSGRDSMHPVWGDEWLELLGNFEQRLLCYGNCHQEQVCCEDRSLAVKDFLAEGQANADFQHVVREVAERLARTLPGEHARSGLSVFDKWRGPLNVFMRLRRSRDVSELKEKALRDFRGAAQSRFKVLWAVSSFDERAQLYALAHGGSPNVRRPAAISSLVSRGLVTAEDPIQLCSEAFGRFIVEDLDDSLDDWRRKGHGDWWRVTWLPLVLLAGLGLLFFINSNPEAVGVIAAIGAAFIGLVPVVTSLFRVGQFGQPAVSSGDE